jgi:hypothetical protein
MVESLLKLVQILGAHVASGKKSTAAWNEVNKRFFELEELAQFKEKHYKNDTQNKEDFRKLRDKFNSTMEEVTRDISTGNQSGKEGDLSPIYELVRQIKFEIDDADEKATAAKEKKECDQQQLASNERSILSLNGTKRKANGNTAIRVKDVDGTITAYHLLLNSICRGFKKSVSVPPCKIVFNQLLEVLIQIIDEKRERTALTAAFPSKYSLANYMLR